MENFELIKKYFFEKENSNYIEELSESKEELSFSYNFNVSSDYVRKFKYQANEGLHLFFISFLEKINIDKYPKIQNIDSIYCFTENFLENSYQNRSETNYIIMLKQKDSYAVFTLKEQNKKGSLIPNSELKYEKFNSDFKIQNNKFSLAFTEGHKDSYEELEFLLLKEFLFSFSKNRIKNIVSGLNINGENLLNT